MASTAAASLSWNSSSWRNNCTLTTNIKEPKKFGKNGSVVVVYAQKKVKKIRQVILKEDITSVGKKGEQLSVRAGYYRNFLLPNDKARLLTPLVLKEMKMEEERIEAEKIRIKEEAQQLARVLEAVGVFKVKRKAGRGKLFYGRVGPQDLVDVMKAQLQRDFNKKYVTLPEIKETGEYIAELQLHPEVKAQVRLIVSAN